MIRFLIACVVGLILWIVAGAWGIRPSQSEFWVTSMIAFIQLSIIWRGRK